MGIQLFTPSAIPSGAIINGVAEFRQPTKPTTRIDGSPLVVGDKWYNPSTGDEAFWNGVYFVGQLISEYYALPYEVSVATYASTISVAGPYNQFASALPVILYTYMMRLSVVTQDASNYWTAQAMGYGTISSAFDVRNASININRATVRVDIGGYYISELYDIRPWMTKVGSPPNLLCYGTGVSYRRVFS